MTITNFGLYFGTIYVNELDEWFWSVWDNQALELQSPPIFFGFCKTFEEVKEHAEEYSLKAVKGEPEFEFWDDEQLPIDTNDGNDVFDIMETQKINEYTRLFFNDAMETINTPFISRIKKGKYYFLVAWASHISFLKNEEPIYFNKKATEDEYQKCLKKYKRDNGYTPQRNGNYAKYYMHKLSAIENETKRPKKEGVNIVEFLYTADLPLDWDEPKEWSRHRIVKQTAKSIFVERLPYRGGGRLPKDWRVNVIFTARLDRAKLEKDGVIYSKTFQSWFYTYDRMMEELKKPMIYKEDHYHYKSWNEEDEVVEEGVTEEELANALKLYGLTEIIHAKELKKLFNKAAHKHHPDVGGTHEAFIAYKKAFDILMAKISSQN